MCHYKLSNNQIIGITKMNKDPLANYQKEKEFIVSWQGTACEENTGVTLSDTMFSGVKKKKNKTKLLKYSEEHI